MFWMILQTRMCATAWTTGCESVGARASVRERGCAWVKMSPRACLCTNVTVCVYKHARMTRPLICRKFSFDLLKALEHKLQQLLFNFIINTFYLTRFVPKWNFEIDESPGKPIPRDFGPCSFWIWCLFL